MGCFTSTDAVKEDPKDATDDSQAQPVCVAAAVVDESDTEEEKAGAVDSHGTADSLDTDGAGPLATDHSAPLGTDGTDGRASRCASGGRRRRFQVLLNSNWVDLGRDELDKINETLQDGGNVVEMQVRGAMYEFDLEQMKQTNKQTNRARRLREVKPSKGGIGADEVIATVSATDSLGLDAASADDDEDDEDDEQDEARQDDAKLALIPPHSRKPYHPFTSEEVDWKWQIAKDRGEWRTYANHESIEIDRYYQAYLKQDPSLGPVRSLAKTKVGGKQVTVDFLNNTVQVEGASVARSIERQLRPNDWLTNKYFFDSFIACLRNARIDVSGSDPEVMFDFRYSQDFRTIKDSGKKLSRGGHEYTIPCGWKRFAVNVKGRFDNGNNNWLREDNSGWAVAYHGTEGKNLPGILSTGFRVGPRQKFEKTVGSGVYCTYDLDLASKYAPWNKLSGDSAHETQMVLQMRVKPDAIRTIEGKVDFEYEKKYWVINDPANMRAYGVLIRGR